jgi:hypothetical protein
VAQLDDFYALSADWSDDGQRIALLCNHAPSNGAASFVWEWKTGDAPRPRNDMPTPGFQPRIQFVADDKQLIIAARDAWSIQDVDRGPDEHWSIPGPRSQHEPAYDISNDRVALARRFPRPEDEHSLWVCDLAGRPLLAARTPSWRGLARIALIDRGRRVVAAGDFGLLGWDCATGQPLRGPAFEHRQPVHQVAAARDAPLLAISESSGTCRVYETDDWTEVGKRFRLVGEPLRLDFLPDGRRLLVTDRRRGTQLWDWRRGAPLNPPLSLGGPLHMAEPSTDGRWLAVNLLDRTQFLVPLPPGNADYELPTEKPEAMRIPE